MTDELIEKIVLDDLILSYMMNIEFDTDEGGIYIERDESLLDALEKVIEYYSSQNEYEKFLKEIKPIRERNAQAVNI